MDDLNKFTEQNLEADTNNDVSTQNEIPLSEKIGTLLDALANVQQVFETSSERVLHMDRLTQDLLHAIELQDTTYHERARIAMALQQCRRQRRPDKDNIYLTESIAGFLRSEKGKKFIKQLEHLHNLSQHVERTAPGRKYNPRVLTLEEYRNVAKKKPRLKQGTQVMTE